MQKYYEHGAPVEVKVRGAPLNLTFCWVKRHTCGCACCALGLVKEVALDSWLSTKEVSDSERKWCSTGVGSQRLMLMCGRSFETSSCQSCSTWCL